MTWNWKTSALWQRLLVALLVVAVATAIRALFFGGLGRGTAYLTYYPAVMIAALYGGLWAGFLATGISAGLVFFWIQRGFMSPVESLAMGAFGVSCTMVSFICEAMRRATTRAKQAQEKAEAANRAKSVFLASMSHELRTPLNAILGFSGLMRDDTGIPEEHRQTLDLINRSGEHLLSLINEVLDMAKIEAGGIALETAPCDLGAMVRDVTDLLRERAAEKNLQLQLDQSSEFPRFVRADAAKLRQVIINLVGNAIKFTEQGSVTLRLQARPTAEPRRLRLIVEVADTGSGIAPADQARIFEPFVQVGRQNTQKGTGLGLTITRKFVELMDGRIGVESTLGQGSIFRVELPVVRAEESEVSAAKIKQERIVGLAPGQPEYRILIVEDQMENWLLLKRLLENVGFTARVAGNSEEGIATFQSWRPHFIWMDIRMAGMDGLEATRRIRTLEGGREAKIVALTASVFKEERDHVMAAGMDDFIRKPYRPEEIYDCLTRHLGVRFTYADAPAVAAAAETLAPLRPDALADLPSALRGELADALVSLDAARIGEAVRMVSEQNPALGERLAQHASQLDYTFILQALQASGEGPPTPINHE